VRSFLVILAFMIPFAAQNSGSKEKTVWRAATESELKKVIPARAPVEKERIETEARTASGITDGKAYVAGVVLITAGYSADGKYSHFFFTQVPLTVGGISLKPGDYVFGWQKNPDSLTVKFYEAQTGKFLGTVEAVRNSRIGKIESFHVYPPSEKSIIRVGRFGFSYRIGT
jgi:hypothetical protein